MVIWPVKRQALLELERNLTKFKTISLAIKENMGSLKLGAASYQSAGQ
jgi:hypothetical protein